MDYHEPWINKGDVLRALGRYTEAEHCYTQSLTLVPKNVKVLSRLVLIYSDYLYDYEKAISVSTKLLEIEPDFGSRVNHAEALIKAGSYAQGREYALVGLGETNETLYQSVLRFLILSSYLFEGDPSNGEKALVSFLEYYDSLDKEFVVDESEWTFRGMINKIWKTVSNTQAKFLLLTLIDLLRGKVNRKNLSFFHTP
jgi:tetratricopeptide (TPR) repeat protein